MRDDELIRMLQTRLEQEASPKTKDWWEKYLCNVIEFRGVGIPKIRSKLSQWRSDTGIDQLENGDQLRIALRLFESSIAEDKLAGILFLQEYLFDNFEWTFVLPKYEQLYARNQIFDWNICDWFCVRVLAPTIRMHGDLCARTIADWNQSENLWQARSSIVAFVPIASESRYHRMIYESCALLIQRNERFAKTAVGWMLHDLSKCDKEGVAMFVKRNLPKFSLEAMKNALKYFPDNERNILLSEFKAS